MASQPGEASSISSVLVEVMSFGKSGPRRGSMGEFIVAAERACVEFACVTNSRYGTP
ncbi:hypothetical protein D3C71_2173680 [compost metagenome]